MGEQGGGSGGLESSLVWGGCGVAAAPQSLGLVLPKAQGSGGCLLVAPGEAVVTLAPGGEAVVTLAPSVPRAELEEEFGQWDELLEGVGDSVVPDAPFCRSHL